MRNRAESIMKKLIMLAKALESITTGDVSANNNLTQLKQFRELIETSIGSIGVDLKPQITKSDWYKDETTAQDLGNTFGQLAGYLNALQATP
jgi:hypothetical protein